MEGQPTLKKTEFMSISLQPELAALKPLASGPENEFRAAVIDALMDMKGLRAMEDLFFFERTWNEALPAYSDAVVGQQTAYRVDLFRAKLTPPKMALRVVISKTKEGSLRQEKAKLQGLRKAYEATRDEAVMEKIIDQELLLLFDEPLIVNVPCKDGAYSMMILLTPGETGRLPRRAKDKREPREPDLVTAPQPIQSILPSYPDELRKRGVSGEIGLRLTIDEKGNVQKVEVLKGLHPYLDYSAVQAFMRWTFEPVLRKEKPVRAKFDYAFNFDPQRYAEEAAQAEEPAAGMDQASQKELLRILNGSAEYCRKLAEAALFYTCEETIKETHNQLKPPKELSDTYFNVEEWIAENMGPAGGGITRKFPVQIFDPARTERNVYTSDYQLIRKSGKVEERRIVLKENGRKIADQKKLLEDSRYSVLMPIFAPIQILAQDRQSLFNYRILDEESVHGQKAVVVEAVPKSGDADGVRSGKIWVDKKDFQILKTEIEGIPIEGYEDVLKDSILLNIKPIILIKHEFGVEKKGILFPESTAVRVEYPVSRMVRPVLKMKIDLSYKKFRFFTVETGHEVIK